jgi:hypothetical protein
MVKHIKQVNRPGLYTSDIINERYQVLESEAFKGSYFVYDLVKDDMIRRRDGGCNYLESLDAAMAVATGLGMVAKAVKVKQPKAEKTAAVKEPKTPKEPKAPKEPGEPKAKRPSVGTTMGDLIKTTQLTDEEISAELLKLFPDSKSCKPYDVKYRRRLIEAGKL